MPLKGEQAGQSKLSEAEQRKQILSGARSEMNMHKFSTESADMVLRESNLQIHSQRMGLEVEERERAVERTRI